MLALSLGSRSNTPLAPAFLHLSMIALFSPVNVDPPRGNGIQRVLTSKSSGPDGPTGSAAGPNAYTVPASVWIEPPALTVGFAGAVMGFPCSKSAETAASLSGDFASPVVGAVKYDRKKLLECFFGMSSSSGRILFSEFPRWFHNLY